jgi:hypothetical protein
LLLKTVNSAGEFVRRAKTKEIESYDAPPAFEQVGDEIVPDMKVIWKAVHKHKSGTSARVVACKNSFLLRETWCSTKAGAALSEPAFSLATSFVMFVAPGVLPLKSADARCMLATNTIPSVPFREQTPTKRLDTLWEGLEGNAKVLRGDNPDEGYSLT